MAWTFSPGVGDVMEYCPHCAYELRGFRLRCPDCHRLTIGWLHVALVAALDAVVLALLMKLI